LVGEKKRSWWGTKKTKRRRRRPCISIALIRVCKYHMDRLTHTQLTARYTVIWTQDMKKISKECKTKGGHIPWKGEWKGRKNRKGGIKRTWDQVQGTTWERVRQREGERQREKDTGREEKIMIRHEALRYEDESR
jgi:hypothetical protein